MPNTHRPILYIECESDDGTGKMYADTLVISEDLNSTGLLILTGETPKRLIMRHTAGMICDFLFGRQGRILYQNIKLYNEHLEYLEIFTFNFKTNNFANMREKVETFIYMLDNPNNNADSAHAVNSDYIYKWQEK